MVYKRILYCHLVTLLLLLINVLIALITGYNFNSGFLLAICIGYYITLLAGFIYIKPINKSLKDKLGSDIGYVLSLSGILLAELLTICITGLFVFLVLLFDMNAPVKASGLGYEIRLQPALEWPERYVLYKRNFLLEKYMGDIHANEEDFKIGGIINNVASGKDTISVSINNNGKDTGILFRKP